MRNRDSEHAALTQSPSPDGPLRTVFIREAIIKYRGRGVRTEDPIREPFHAVAFARRVVRDEAREHFLAMYLDGRHRPVAHSVVSIGTATASLVHPREVFQAAVLTGSAAVIVLHNHPSGDPKPSTEDHDVTKRLARAGQILGVSLLDSIVWTHSGRLPPVSFKECHPEYFSAAP